VRISEVMYHPVAEEDFEDQHEFVELHNAGELPADLTGWAFDRGLSWTFDGGTLEPGGTLVLAADPSSLADVYDLEGMQVLGGYAGRLSNGGELLRLVDAAGDVVDELRYDDAFPWPIGADALGASAPWLPADWLPVEDHALRGRSLQRLSFEAPGDDPANWVASPLDGADPGVVVSAVGPELPAVALAWVWGDGGPGPLVPGQPVALQVFLSGEPPPGLHLEWFADDVQVDGEPLLSAPLLAAGDGLWAATLPAQPDETILRARIAADDGVLSPRPNDPMAWHAAFVAWPVPGSTRPYRLYVDTVRWTSLWDAVQPGRLIDSCNPNPGWDLRVPAVFVVDGDVYDVQVRYQGSRWNRSNGRSIPTWPAPGPDRPAPLRALSWSVKFPRYAPFEGRSSIVLNKLTQGCPGLNAAVGFGLFDEVGLPVPEVRFARLFINGAYFNYTLEIESPGEEMLDRWLAAAPPSAPPEPGAPHLFKSGGCNCDEGPYGWGDGRPLEDHCGYTALERTEWTYERKTWDWAGHDELQALLEDHEAARGGSDEDLAAFLADRFDVELVLSYLAVMNWAVPFDDMFQNHYWVQRRSDGRWFFAPWDLDLDFGGWKGADASIHMGEEGDPDNRSGWWHRVKDSFLAVYRPEYEARLLELNETVLHPVAVSARVDAVEAAWSLGEAAASPGGLECSFVDSAAAFRSFAQQRHDVVAAIAAP
jgi:hypothetical protein